MKRTTDNVLTEWLVLGAQKGDADSVASLVQLMYPRLLRYAANVLGDKEIARDIVQAAFEVLIRDLRKLKDPAAFSGWLYRITHNKCVDLIRKQQLQRDGNASYQLNLTAQQDTSEQADTLALEEVLRQLNSAQYQLVHLYYLEGFSLREVARMLDVPEGTVKSRLFQLRDKLKPLLLGDTHE